MVALFLFLKGKLVNRFVFSNPFCKRNLDQIFYEDNVGKNGIDAYDNCCFYPQKLIPGLDMYVYNKIFLIYVFVLDAVVDSRVKRIRRFLA